MLRSRGNFAEGLNWLERSQAGFTTLQDSAGIATVLRGIGVVYWSQGDYAKAMECYEEAVRISEQAGDLRSVYRSLNNSGQIFFNQGDQEKALEYYEKAQAMAMAAKDRFAEAILVGNIGTSYLSARRMNPSARPLRQLNTTRLLLSLPSKSRTDSEGFCPTSQRSMSTRRALVDHLPYH